MRSALARGVKRERACAHAGLLILSNIMRRSAP